MTSIRAAGYSSRGRSTNQAFDPFNQVPDTNFSSFQSPLERIKTLERKVIEAVDESALAAQGELFILALEKAKDAVRKEKQLLKQREQLELEEQPNMDLTFLVLFNLANQQHGNKMYTESLNTFNLIVKNKLFNQSGRMRVNMGKIYYEQGKYSQAIKMYRMALDQISNSNREYRLQIMRNIGSTFVKQGLYLDAITAFESIMDLCPDYRTSFNLILCYYGVGDREKMKRGFQRLVSISLPILEHDEENSTILKDEPIDDQAVFNQDSLRNLSREKRDEADRYILMAAKLVAPSIESTFTSGFDWMIEILKSSINSHMSAELEIAKSVQYLKSKDFDKAIDCLKEFERKDQKLAGIAATNLSFLYYLEGDLKNSEHFVDIAIENDRYNSKAQTNKGNNYFSNGQLEKARDQYLNVIGVDAVCTEAMFNLGLVFKNLTNYKESLQWFEKLHSILRSSPEVLYQIADLY